eukprot:gene58-211_t
MLSWELGIIPGLVLCRYESLPAGSAIAACLSLCCADGPGVCAGVSFNAAASVCSQGPPPCCLLKKNVGAYTKKGNPNYGRRSWEAAGERY